MARTLYQFFARTRIWFWWVCLFPALQIVNSGSGPPPGVLHKIFVFFVNSWGLSYLGEANSKVELWPSKRISRSWRHHLPASLQSSRHGKRCIGDGNQSMCFFQASSKDVNPEDGRRYWIFNAIVSSLHAIMWTNIVAGASWFEAIGHSYCAVQETEE